MARQRSILHLLFPLFVVISATTACATDSKLDWQKLRGEDIRQALSSRTLAYGKSITQDFKPSGRTLYDAGKPSWGYWRVQSDQYCSQWPPQELWSCYDVFISANGRELRFVGEHGDESVGKYVDL